MEYGTRLYIWETEIIMLVQQVATILSCVLIFLGFTKELKIADCQILLCWGYTAILKDDCEMSVPLKHMSFWSEDVVQIN